MVDGPVDLASATEVHQGSWTEDLASRKQLARPGNLPNLAKPIRAIPYQDPEMEAERLKKVHEARVKIVPRV